MDNIENVLIALSAGEIRGDLQKFIIVYGEEDTKALGLESMPDFSFWDNGRSVIIYSGNKAIYDCCYYESFGFRKITTCYNRDGLFCDLDN